MHIYTCHTHPLVQKIDKFLYSPAYLLLIGILTVLSNVFCMELYVYPCFIFIGIYICLLGRDLLPLLPIFACGYISPSSGNNPGHNEATIFSLAGGGLFLAVLLFILAVCLVYRLVTDPVFGGRQFLRKKRALLSGMLILGACYAISGLGSGQWAAYGWKNLLFAFLQLVAIAGLYYLLTGAVKWESTPKAYLFWTGICVGYVLLAELLHIYISTNAIVDGVISRGNITTGWGHYNSMGALFALLIPLPFFLTGKGRYAILGYLTAFLFYIGLLFTCSRGSILFGTLIYIAGYILSFVHSRRARSFIAVHIIHVALPIALFILYREELMHLFGGMVELGLNPNKRLTTYAEGIKQFLKYPIFGGSFFPTDYRPHAWASESFQALFPPRWHNTLVQLLATGGVVCLAGYTVHRLQTIKLFVKDFSGEKMFVALSVLALLLTSLIDCHFFNVGPVLFYSASLAFVECRLNKHAGHLK